MGKPEEATAAVLPVLGPSRIPGWGSPPSYLGEQCCTAALSGVNQVGPFQLFNCADCEAGRPLSGRHSGKGSAVPVAAVRGALWLPAST